MHYASEEFTRIRLCVFFFFFIFVFVFLYSFTYCMYVCMHVFRFFINNVMLTSFFSLSLNVQILSLQRLWCSSLTKLRQKMSIARKRWKINWNRLWSKELIWICVRVCVWWWELCCAFVCLLTLYRCIFERRLNEMPYTNIQLVFPNALCYPLNAFQYIYSIIWF